MVDPSLAGWAGLHAAIVDNKAMPAPACDEAELCDFLGVPGAAPGIDRGMRFVESPRVADDQRLSLVVYPAADPGIHDDYLQ